MTHHSIGELNPPSRLMLTPGPSSVDPRIYRALATPLVGHMDPWFNEVLVTEVGELAARRFSNATTKSRFRFPLRARAESKRRFLIRWSRATKRSSR